jgi:hypothetical protein
MVRRRSTARFRNGAPAQRHNNSLDFDLTKATAGTNGFAQRPSVSVTAAESNQDVRLALEAGSG